MNFVIAAGGTGGHLFPGLAVGEVLIARGHRVMLIISEKEIDALATQGRSEFRIERVPGVGMQSKSPVALVKFALKFRAGLNQVKALYRDFAPSAVLGMGGFTSTAPILAGRVDNSQCTDFFGYTDTDGDPFTGDWTTDAPYDIEAWDATLKVNADVGFATLTSITEDQTTNSGDFVSTLIAGQISDADSGAVQGIAITGKNGSYAVPTGGLPVLVTVVMDPPLATTGQCAEIGFSATACHLATNGSLGCK